MNFVPTREQREAAARVIRSMMLTLRAVTLSEDEAAEAADAVLGVVAGLLDEARRDERERLAKHLTDANRIGGPESLQVFIDAYKKEAGLVAMPFQCPSAVIQGCAAINRRVLVVIEGSEAS